MLASADPTCPATARSGRLDISEMKRVLRVSNSTIPLILGLAIVQTKHEGAAQ